MKVTILLATIFAAIAMADQSAQQPQSEEKGCPRQSGSCNGGQPSRPRPNPDDRCDRLGPCECPKGFALVGTKFDSISEQHWECRKYVSECEIDCVHSGKGFRGFCLSDITIDRDLCRVPDCFFDEKEIFSSKGLALNKDKDGFFVIETSQNIRNRDCDLCRDGHPVCLKRVPYFEFHNLLV